MHRAYGGRLTSLWMPFAILHARAPRVNGSAERSLDSKLHLQPNRILSDNTHRYWENGIKVCTESCQRRFIDTFQLYLDAVAQRAIDRDQQHIRSIEHYFELRRDTMGFKPAFAIIVTKMNLPDEVMDHPTIVTIAAACGDMMAIANDLYSYNVE